MLKFFIRKWDFIFCTENHRKKALKWLLSIVFSLVLTNNVIFLVCLMGSILLSYLHYSVHTKVIKGTNRHKSLKSLIGEFDTSTATLMGWMNNFDYMIKENTPIDELRIKYQDIVRHKYNFVFFLISMCILKYCDITYILVGLGVMVITTVIQLTLKEKDYYFNRKWGICRSRFTIYSHHANLNLIGNIYEPSKFRRAVDWVLRVVFHRKVKHGTDWITYKWF